MSSVFEKIIEKLEEDLKLADKEKLLCARENPLQFDSAKGYANGIANSIEIVKQEAEHYEECYKDCGDCEAYDKESTTQGDCIRSMMDEELAEFIEQVSTDSMETISFGTKEYEEIWEHKETALQWLQSEVED